MRNSSVVLVVGLVAAGGFALYYGKGAPAPSATTAPAAQADPQDMQADPNAPGPVDPNAPLPPNHPDIRGGAMGAAMGQPPNDSVHAGLGGGAGAAGEAEPPALTWKAPKDWASAPNPSAMRVATYKVPRAPGATEDTELAVVRAGGDVATNVARWAGQFEGSPAPNETHKKVHDLDVTIVQIEGTYLGGMGPATGSHANWAMLGAIVETKGESYFFKMTGPAATVRAARKPFEAMMDGVAPVGT
jgi:hypothetical protein